jgi:hypothetical protein
MCGAFPDLQETSPIGPWALRSSIGKPLSSHDTAILYQSFETGDE